MKTSNENKRKIAKFCSLSWNDEETVILQIENPREDVLNQIIGQANPETVVLEEFHEMVSGPVILTKNNVMIPDDYYVIDIKLENLLTPGWYFLKETPVFVDGSVDKAGRIIYFTIKETSNGVALMKGSIDGDMLIGKDE